ncbi:MAG: DUF2528 family protein [Bacteroidales bacterium]|nr:DUF2528 family protein [Bacteroidales bacterium]
MKKKYDFTYGCHEANANFEVDTDKFTAELANLTLEFFTWEYNKEADPVDEVLKKIAIRCIEVASENDYNTYGVTDEFNNMEGYPKLDGSVGLTLTNVDAYKFDEDNLFVEITTE